MATKGNLMTFRPDIKVIDATLRDGGLVNSFFFDDSFVRDLYETNIKAGVDYMEFGYKASKEIFNPADFGDWKFCDEESIRRIVGDNNSDLKISVMADVGRCDFKTDFLPKKDSVIDLVRVATYINTMPAAIEMIEYFHDLGYETSCNIMAISTANEKDIKTALELLGNSNVDMIYIVDSYGSFYPEQIRELSELYLEYGEKYNKEIGIHAHNNQQMAFANTIDACAVGVSCLDATMNGMGRGAGNCAMEMLMGFLKNPKYREMPVLRFVRDHIPKLKEQGLVWGYDVPYLLTGLFNCHPRQAIQFIQQNQTDYADFYQTLWDREC